MMNDRIYDSRYCRPSRRRGAVAVSVALMLVTILVFAALTIDVGYLFIVKGQLQNSADAAALAAAGQLINTDVPSQLKIDANLILDAQRYALLNHADQGTVVADRDFIVGHWDVVMMIFLAQSGVRINPLTV